MKQNFLVGKLGTLVGQFFSTGEEHAPPVKQLKNALAHFAVGAADIAATRKKQSRPTLVCRLPTAFRPRMVVSIVSHASYSEKR